MKWRFEPAQEAFESFREAWDTLNASNGGNVLLDSGFVEAAVRHFADASTLLAVCDDPPGGGLALVARARSGFWQTFQPSQAPVGLLLLRDPQGATDLLEGLMADLPGHALGDVRELLENAVAEPRTQPRPAAAQALAPGRRA
jgi:hypothetical protein